MDNFFTSNKISSNYSRTYSKGKSFKFSNWNKKDTYNNDEFIQDWVVYDGQLWVCNKTNTNNIPGTDDSWIKVLSVASSLIHWENFNEK